MKKKIISGLALITALFAIVACGDGESIEDGNTSQPGNNTVQTGGEKTDNGSVTVKNENAVLDKGYGITINGYKVFINDNLENVEAKAGKPANTFETVSCANTGMDHVYSYGSVELYGIKEGDVFRIYSVVFVDDGANTDEGAYIGMEKADVVKKYGEPTTESGKSATYEKEGSKLVFMYDAEGYVVSIELTH